MAADGERLPRVSTEAAVGPVDATAVPRFAGPATFARLPTLDEVGDADVVVVGVPFDSGVSYRPGARFGPSHVRQSSRLLRPYHPELGIAPFGVQQVVDAGDIACNPYDIGAAIGQIEVAATRLLTGRRRLLAIGGDHTIALPLLRAVHARHGPVAVLHFDAHLDTWENYFGQPYTHGTPFRRASEEGLIDQRHSVHVGIRGPLYGAGDLADTERLGFSTIHCAEVERDGLTAAIRRMRDRLGDAPVYVSVDIDVLDPAFAPGTGTPEAGGLTSRELLAMLRALADLELVSADIVEVAPAYDHAEITGIAAAHVAYELLSVMAKGRRGA
jgi:guanidinobutyrase / D-arginase